MSGAWGVEGYQDAVQRPGLGSSLEYARLLWMQDAPLSKTWVLHEMLKPEESHRHGGGVTTFCLDANQTGGSLKSLGPDNLVA